MIRALGLILSSTLTTSLGSPWFLSHFSLKSFLTKSMNLFFIVIRMFQISSSGTEKISSHISGLLWSWKRFLLRFLR